MLHLFLCSGIALITWRLYAWWRPMELAYRIHAHFGSALTSFKIFYIVMGIFMFSSFLRNFNYLSFIRKSLILPRFHNFEHKVQQNNFIIKPVNFSFICNYTVFLSSFLLFVFFSFFSWLALQKVSLFFLHFKETSLISYQAYRFSLF